MCKCEACGINMNETNQHGLCDQCEREICAEIARAEDGYMSDVEADADTLASAGMGTDEDYGFYGYDE